MKGTSLSAVALAAARNVITGKRHGDSQGGESSSGFRIMLGEIFRVIPGPLGFGRLGRLFFAQ